MSNKHLLIYIDAVSMIEKEKRACFESNQHKDVDVLPCAISGVVFTPESGNIDDAFGTKIRTMSANGGSAMGENRKHAACGLSDLANNGAPSLSAANALVKEWREAHTDIATTWLVVNAFDAVKFGEPTLHKPSKETITKVQAHLDIDISHALVVTGTAPVSKADLSVLDRACIQARSISYTLDMTCAIATIDGLHH